MTNLQDLSTGQIKQILSIRQQIEELENQLESIGGLGKRSPGRPKGKAGGMSAAGRKAVAAAAKARWAKYRAETTPKTERPLRKRKKMSAQARAKIAAAARARWAKVKAAGKTSL